MAPLVGLRALGEFFVPERGVLLPRPYVVVAALGCVLGVALATSDAGQRIEWTLYDRFIRSEAADRAPAPDVAVVAIDEPSFAEIGMPWPWPRALHAAVVDQLARAGARTIAFDIVFDVPAANAEDDDEFAAAIARAGSVVLGADHAVIEDRGYDLAQWSDPIAPLADAAAGVGVVRIPYDPDSVLRRALLTYEGRPSLALAVAAREPAFVTPPDVDHEQATLFRFNGEPRRGMLTASYYQALDAGNSLPRDFFKDKHVLIGLALAATTTSDQVDQFTTPVAPRMAGVEVHATIVDALLRNRFIADPFFSAGRVIALCVVAAGVVSAGMYFVGPTAAPAMALGAIVLFMLGGYVGLLNGTRMPVVAPSLTVASAYALTAAYRYGLATRERRMIKRAFQHYVAPAIVEQMLNDPSKLKLGGEEYEVTVLFTDLEGFTTLSEHLTPSELSAHLGEYFKEMLDVLLPQRGTLDKLIGDAIMMYFGCPIPDPRHAADACRGALAMQQRMRALNERWGRESLPRLRTRIGINTGIAVAGNMGTDRIFNYTIIGDCVNLASRLEGVNKEYGTATILGEDTWALVRDQFVTRELDWLRVKGKTRPVAIYELVADAGTVDDRRQDLFSRFAEGLELYRAQRWADAGAAFARAQQLDPRDGPSRVFSHRCEYYRTHAPEAWDGVHVMHVK
ncbi:MAG TPA: adenylate/guanylate cyclase domain-containing protein [Vicinamibacterales bacterium]|nr:adenylate/guanylate cyclase domain-containing protein [Vicinamibacterales bacterium]